MKKYTTTPEYKKHQKSRSQKINRNKSHRHAYDPDRLTSQMESRKARRSSFVVEAPEDFRLFDNTEKCLEFFRDLRNPQIVGFNGNKKYVTITLKHVELIDYGSVSTLMSITDDLGYRGVVLRGDFPKNSECTQFISDSGFLNQMVDENNKKYPKCKKSEMIIFEKGQGKLSHLDNVNISKSVKSVVGHLTGREDHFKPIKTIILEICGNSIEHAFTDHKQWLLGMKYDKEKVIFTFTDVGRGILDTLHKKLSKKVKNVLTSKPDLDILIGAFEKEYGSRTTEDNRNKGLPAVKSNFENGSIKNLIVLTNNVILHFNDPSKSRTFQKGSPRFKGTLYRWEMTKNCIIKTITQ